jgi:hypothetical protein
MNTNLWVGCVTVNGTAWHRILKLYAVISSEDDMNFIPVIFYIVKQQYGSRMKK